MFVKNYFFQSMQSGKGNNQDGENNYMKYYIAVGLAVLLLAGGFVYRSFSSKKNDLKHQKEDYIRTIDSPSRKVEKPQAKRTVARNILQASDEKLEQLLNVNISGVKLSVVFKNIIEDDENHQGIGKSQEVHKILKNMREEDLTSLFARLKHKSNVNLEQMLNELLNLKDYSKSSELSKLLVSKHPNITKYTRSIEIQDSDGSTEEISNSPEKARKSGDFDENDNSNKTIENFEDKETTNNHDSKSDINASESLADHKDINDTKKDLKSKETSDNIENISEKKYTEKKLDIIRKHKNNIDNIEKVIDKKIENKELDIIEEYEDNAEKVIQEEIEDKNLDIIEEDENNIEKKIFEKEIVSEEDSNFIKKPMEEKIKDINAFDADMIGMNASKDQNDKHLTPSKEEVRLERTPENQKYFDTAQKVNRVTEKQLKALLALKVLTINIEEKVIESLEEVNAYLKNSKDGDINKAKKEVTSEVIDRILENLPKKNKPKKKQEESSFGKIIERILVNTPEENINSIYKDESMNEIPKVLCKILQEMPEEKVAYIIKECDKELKLKDLCRVVDTVLGREEHNDDSIMDDLKWFIPDLLMLLGNKLNEKAGEAAKKAGEVLEKTGKVLSGAFSSGFSSLTNFFSGKK